MSLASKNSKFGITLFTLFIFLLAFGLSINSAPKKDKKPPKDPLDKLSLGILKFRSIGPALTSGRISDFAVNPDNRKEFYVASSSGGVWKTINAGTTFTPIFDSQGSYSIGCITMDPSNHNVIWVGTGENNNQRSVAYGDGVYKSIDGGKTWKNTGLKKSEHIGQIAIDPGNTDTVYVAAYGPLWSEGGDRGLYKTTDGGATWEKILEISEHTGVSEVHLDPRNPKVIYATAHQRRRHVFTQISGGPESGIHKSTDGGATWNKINSGLPGGDKGRIALAISPVDPEYLYAIVEAKRGQGGFYRSLNRGASWEKRSSYSTSGNYYQEIICDPKDPNRVYSMATFAQVTDDGGKTWHALGDRSKHWDSHAIWIDPKDTDYYLNGNDGGVYESFDRGKTWKYMSNLPVTQFYKVSVDNASPFFNVYGGTQDNYSLAGPSRTINAHGIMNSDWVVTQGGDGFETQVDPKNHNIVYAQSQYGGLTRFDKKSGENLRIKPSPRKGEKNYRWNWDAPLLISPHSSTRLYFAANKVFRSDDRGSSWKVISNDLSRQIDRNQLKVMGKIWPMDAVAKNASTSQYGTIVALDESPLKENTLYIGTDDGLIQVTEDQGKTWRKIDSFPGVPERTYVNEVLASQHDKETVYAAFNNHKNGDFKPYILKSTNAGRSWTSIASNLPERGSVYALAEDHVKKDLLFAGTEFGVFVSLNGGKKWKPLKSGLPTIAVRDIAIQKRENSLVLGTFGRSFYVLDDYTPLRQFNKNLLEKPAHIFPVKEALLFVEAYPLGSLGTKQKGFQGESFFSVPNPPVCAEFTYYLKDKIKTKKDLRLEKEKKILKDKKEIYFPTYDELKAEGQEDTPYLFFTITDEADNIIRELRTSPGKGLHKITWDLRYPGFNPPDPQQTNPTKGVGSSTFVYPGKYKVFLSKNVSGAITKLTDPISFDVKALDNTSLPVQNKTELASFQKKALKLNHTMRSASSLLNELSTKTKYYRAALKYVINPNQTIFSDIKNMENKLDEIRIKLYGNNLLRSLDQDAEPGLMSRISSALYGHWRSTSALTQSEKELFSIASQEFPPILEKLKEISNKDVKIIEKKLDDLGAPYTPGRFPKIK